MHERQVGRWKTPADKLPAIVRAYAFAIRALSTASEDRLALEAKARELVELALMLHGVEDPFEALYQMAREVDEEAESTTQRHALIEAMVASGVGPRDGGRTRSASLRRAAQLMREELHDQERAFDLLSQSLIAHVDASTLDAIEASTGDDPRRAEAILSRAMLEVFDGPLVRQLISRRASIRQDKLNDVEGALTDLRKLHELSPSDQGVTDRYGALLSQSNDYRGSVQLCEDQILRSKDQGTRADLARKIALLWEERLGEPREAADAWRRVLRLRPQDPEATAGLDRAKRNHLNFDANRYPPQRVHVAAETVEQIDASASPAGETFDRAAEPQRPPPNEIDAHRRFTKVASETTAERTTREEDEVEVRVDEVELSPAVERPTAPFAGSTTDEVAMARHSLYDNEPDDTVTGSDEVPHHEARSTEPDTMTTSTDDAAMIGASEGDHAAPGHAFSEAAFVDDEEIEEIDEGDVIETGEHAASSEIAKKAP
ncbi:MAG: hypothetical protein NVSMB1_05710 [Polyangiales bacterium]